MLLAANMVCRLLGFSTCEVTGCSPDVLNGSGCCRVLIVVGSAEVAGVVENFDCVVVVHDEVDEVLIMVDGAVVVLTRDTMGSSSGGPGSSSSSQELVLLSESYLGLLLSGWMNAWCCGTEDVGGSTLGDVVLALLTFTFSEREAVIVVVGRTDLLQVFKSSPSSLLGEAIFSKP